MFKATQRLSLLIVCILALIPCRVQRIRESLARRVLCLTTRVMRATAGIGMNKCTSGSVRPDINMTIGVTQTLTAPCGLFHRSRLRIAVFVRMITAPDLSIQRMVGVW